MHPHSDPGGPTAPGRVHHLSPVVDGSHWSLETLEKRPVTLSGLINTSDSFLTIFKIFTFLDRICLSDSWVPGSHQA